MTTSSCKRAFLFLAGAAFLLAGCAATGDRSGVLTPVHWAVPGQQGGREGFSWAGESRKGQWAGLKVAVLPVHNMTSAPAPLEELETLLYQAMENRKVPVLEKEALERFMAGRRLRYTGGIDKTSAMAMVKETGTEAVLITSLEHFDEGPPPKISLHTRLVSLEPELGIRWMDSFCGAGDDSPGFLDLGLIEDSRALMQKAVDQLAGSLMINLADERIWESGTRSKRGEKPMDIYHSAGMELEGPVTVAVIPFLNLSERSFASEILPLHFVRNMAGMPGLQVLEPGEVRQAMLSSRVYLQGGLSRPHLDLVLNSTGADLVLTGTVMRYLDTRTASKDPEVEFSVEIFDRESREVVWSSRSAGTGGDGVFFFGAGRRSTACGLTEAIAGATVLEMFGQSGDQKTKIDKGGKIP